MENKKKLNLLELAIKHQKKLIISTLLLSSLYLIYALIFSTPFYGMYYYSAPGIYYVQGAELYAKVQPFNKALLNLVLFQFLFIVAIFIYMAQKRRIFYLSNYITIGAYALFSVGLAIYNIINIIGFRLEYAKVDFEKLQRLSERTGIKYRKSTFTIDFGILLSVLAILLTTALVILAIAKYKSRKKELELKALKLKEKTEVAQENA